MIVENGPVGVTVPLDDGVVERAIQSVQGVIWTIHRSERRRDALCVAVKLTCMWEAASTGASRLPREKSSMENRSGVWLTRTARRTTEQEEWKGSNLEMIVEVPWRKNVKNGRRTSRRRVGQ